MTESLTDGGLQIMLKERIIVNTNSLDTQFYNNNTSSTINPPLIDMLKWYTLVVDSNIVAVENLNKKSSDKK